MHKYRVLIPVTLRGINVFLEGNQLERRKDLVVDAVDDKGKVIKKGLYTPKTEIQFKVGEEITLPEPAPKFLLQAHLGEPDSEKAAKKDEKDDGKGDHGKGKK